MGVALLLFILTAFIYGIPAYVIGQRRGISRPRVAFIPIVGFWIIVFESIDRPSSWAALALIPYVGDVVLGVWAALKLPAHHNRSQWWIAALIIPGPNLIGYWVYAFTLPKQTTPAFQGAAA